MSKRIDCFWALGALNYKNNKATTCPRQWDTLSKLDNPLPSNIINQPKFNALRKSLWNGQWPYGCKTCEEFEKDNYHPYRLHHRITPEMEEGFDKETGRIKYSNLKHIEFRFSNACNFSCMHCSSAFSSGWADKLKNYTASKEVITANLEQLTDAQLNNYSLNADTCNAIFNDLCENFHNLEMIDVSGGEPLYQKQLWNMLDKLKDHPNAKNIRINITSNFNVPNCNYIELSNKLSNFGQSNIRISVDGGKNIYPYFRSGKWETLVENINNFRKNNTFTKVEATCTTSVYQMLDIENVITDMANLNVDKLHTSFVQFPTYINPTVIKHKFEQEIKTDLIHLIVDKFNDNSNIIDICRKILEYFDKKECIEEDYKRFIVYVKAADKMFEKEFNKHFTKYKINFDKNEIEKNE